MLCVEIAVRSPNQEPYWSMSVFVSILVCEAAKHVARADTHTQTSKHTNTAWSADVPNSLQSIT